MSTVVVRSLVDHVPSFGKIVASAWAVVFLGGVVTSAVWGEDAPAALYPRGKPELVVQSNRRIWSEAPHNAFPDICRYRDRWFVSFREGTVHGETGFGKVRLIASGDGETWKSAALFESFGDYRRAALSVTPDQRLMMVCRFNAYAKAAAGADKKDLLQAVDHQGKKHEVITVRSEDLACFSSDGATWSTLEAVQGTKPQAWFHGGVFWHQGAGYALDRQLGARSSLYRTSDGLHFELVTTEVPAGNESRLGILPDERLIAFFRNGSLATSVPPYREWTLNDANRQGNHSHAGPCLLALPNGDVWTVCRYRVAAGDGFALPPGQKELDGTAMFKLEGDKLVPKLLIPGGGDRGYSGLAWRDGLLWLAYNAPSRELNKSSIFLAKIKPVK